MGGSLRTSSCSSNEDKEVGVKSISKNETAKSNGKGEPKKESSQEREENGNWNRNQNFDEDITKTKHDKSVTELDFDGDITFVKTVHRTKAAKKGHNAIFGLTVLGQQLFVINKHSPDVEVYDSQSLNFNHQFHLNGLYDPVDIKSCSKRNCIFIFDWKDEESGEIVSVASDGKLINKWKTDGGGYISVTPEANVILGVWRARLLKEFTADGAFLRDIHLPASIMELRSAIQLPNGHFVISQGENAENDHRVSIVDDNGAVLKSIGGKHGSSNGEFYSPAYLVVDESGFILVADQNNMRVVLLSPDLEFRREVIQEREGLRYPVRMDLDRTSGRLFVAHNDNLEGHELGDWRDGGIKALDFKLH